MAPLNIPVLLPLAVLAATAVAILALDRTGRQHRLSGWTALTSLTIAPVLGLIMITSGQGGMAQSTLYGDGSSTLWTLVLCSVGAVIVMIDLGKQAVANSLHYALILLLACGALIVIQAAHLIALGIGVAMVYATLIALSGPENAFRPIVLCGTSLASLLLGSVCLYGVTGTLHVPLIVEQLGRQNAVTSDLLAILGFDLCIAGSILIPAAIILNTNADEMPGRTTGAMVCSLVLPLIGVARLGTWIDLLPESRMLLLELIGAAGMAAGYGIALRARRVQNEWLGVAVAEFARLTLITCLLPGAPFLFYQAAGSTSAIAGLWALSTLIDDKNSRRSMSPAAGLGRERPYTGITFTLCLLSLGGMPPLIGAINQVWLLRALAERGQLWIFALAVFSCLIAWLWAARWMIRLWLGTPTVASRKPLSPEAGTILLIVTAGTVLAGWSAGPILSWIETMLAF
ncbi:MAG: hypothetical protein JW934_16910 [Anaerolineae bacterium]|nr:hypothetical protein [Anaerolineae bacterium]